MNRNNSIRATVFCLLLATLGTASAESTRTAGESVDDKTIATQTKLALIDDSTVDAGDINVEAHSGRVLLIGFVDSKEQRSQAIKIAEDIDYVEDVIDAMVVMSGKRSFGRVIDDETIHAAIKLKLADAEGLGGATAVVVDVKNGETLIGGFVDSKDTVDDIAKLVRNVDGVEKVHNGLQVK